MQLSIDGWVIVSLAFVALVVVALRSGRAIRLNWRDGLNAIGVETDEVHSPRK